VAVVRPYKRVYKDRYLGTTIVEKDLGKCELVTVAKIGGLVGKIAKVKARRKKIYLVEG
jgi:hypothetical protein